MLVVILFLAFQGAAAESLAGKVLEGGRDVNLEQVRRGLAWHYRKYQSEQSPEDRTRYSDAEAAARTARLGLWADPEPIPPWSWRKR